MNEAEALMAELLAYLAKNTTLYVDPEGNVTNDTVRPYDYDLAKRTAAFLGVDNPIGFHVADS